MTAKHALHDLIEKLPESKLTQLLEFGEFLNSQENRVEWNDFGRGQLARAYSPDEPEYSLDDLKQRQDS